MTGVTESRRRVDDPVAALHEARLLTEATLRGALDRLDPQTRRVCGYHLGYWDADEARPGTGAGKGLRPSLALLSARAGGAAFARGVPAAAACELVHNFSLLHDDVMDGDTERRHRPAVWARFGTSTAILAGDALLGLATEVLSEAPSPAVPEAVRRLSATIRRLVAGQAADLDLERAGATSLAQCLQVAADKTGALLACSASLGAVLVDAPDTVVRGLTTYGAQLGLAFQLTDDLLGIYGSPDRTGKPARSDLRAGKQSFPVVAALQSGTAAGEVLRRLCDRDDLTESELEHAAELVDRSGGLARTRREAAHASAASLAALEHLGLPRDAHEALTDLAERVNERDH